MIKQQITAEIFLPVFKRKRQVMFAIFDNHGNLHLSRKSAYPPGIYRLFGGGVESEETFQQAAVRELREETGLSLSLDLVDTLHFDLTELSSQQHFTYTIQLYRTLLQQQPIHSADDVDSSRPFSPQDISDLLKRYHQLQREWTSWGLIFSEITKAALN
jgi:8-oxo-dGTP pyrophosphatase MutT (NUDIX family)